MSAPRGSGQRRFYCTQFREQKEREDRERGRNSGAASAGKKAGQKLARFAKEALVKRGVVGWSFRTHIESSGAAGNVGGKTGGGLHAAGSTDSDEDGAVIECLKDLLQLKRSLAEPADVRADFASAGAAWNLTGRFVERGVREGREATGVATALEKLAVHVEDAFRARLLVKIVDVLRAQKKPVVKNLLESSKGNVAGIWPGGGRHFAAHGVEIPNKMRIAPPSKGRSDFLDPIIAPESAGIAKSRNAAFGADARTSEDKNAIGGRDGELWHWRDQGDSSTPRSKDCPRVRSRFCAEELRDQAMRADLRPASPRISARMLETTPGTLAATSGDKDMPAEKSSPSIP